MRITYCLILSSLAFSIEAESPSNKNYVDHKTYSQNLKKVKPPKTGISKNNIAQDQILNKPHPNKNPSKTLLSDFNQSEINRYPNPIENSYIQSIKINTLTNSEQCDKNDINLDNNNIHQKLSDNHLGSIEDEEISKLGEEILAKTNYSLTETQFETTSWLTVFIAQFYTKVRMELEKNDSLLNSISDALNSELKPSIIDSIIITQFSLGTDFPRILSARMSPSSNSFGMMAELQFEFIDGLSLGFDTRVVAKFLQETIASLPVSMVLSITKFIGTVTIDIDFSNKSDIILSINPDYILEIDLQTLIGSHAKLQNLPMLTSLITRKLRSAFENELIKPNSKRIPLKGIFSQENINDDSLSNKAKETPPTKPVDPVDTNKKSQFENNTGFNISSDQKSNSSYNPSNYSTTDSKDNLRHRFPSGRMNSSTIQKILNINTNDLDPGYSQSNASPTNGNFGHFEIPDWYNTQVPPRNTINIDSNLNRNSFSSGSGSSTSRNIRKIDNSEIFNSTNTNSKYFSMLNQLRRQQSKNSYFSEPQFTDSGLKSLNKNHDNVIYASTPSKSSKKYQQDSNQHTYFE
ncbi:Maintenance of mitochondrial morphology protein 1 [Smittium culicis]|uniref:Maintenance of mitochondrial morphology protein 1 n=1 Tax=Smittium culicis TaxID=133412 RepID=A0A1R1YLD4_9FUNG|nr:Maintenance of mitochondrial morphology protein 1 [Smittium culicis]